jgi:hypothetical protein
MKRNELIYDEVNKRPQQQPLSLSDISPTWAKRLQEKQPLPSLISLTRLRWLSEIADPRKCVVAEAYGFSSLYTISCRQCTIMANKFSLYFAMCWHKKLEKVQQMFVKHWNEKHA